MEVQEQEEVEEPRALELFHLPKSKDFLGCLCLQIYLRLLMILHCFCNLIMYSYRMFYRAEPAYSFIVFDRFLAIEEL